MDNEQQQNTQEQASQGEAEKQNALPEGVGVEMTPVEEYSKENEQVKNKLAEFGQTDLEQFIAKVGSDTIYARQVVRKLLGLDGDKPFLNLEHRTSPQERNITGTLVHATYPPTIKGGPNGTEDEKVDAAK